MSEERKIPTGKTHDYSLLRHEADYTLLRHEAEKLQKPVSEEDVQNMPAHEIRQLIQELQIHQVELEMQNHQLHLATQELEAATLKYRDLYHHAPFGYVTLDEHGIIEEVNAKGNLLLEAGREQLIDRRFSQFVHPDSLDVYYGFFRNVLLSDKPQTIELQLLVGNARAFYAQVEGLLLRRPNDTDQCRLAFVDVTERKEAHLELFNKEALLSAIINNSLNSIQVLKAVRNASGRLIDFEWVLLNRTAEVFLDYTLEQLGKKRLSEVLPSLLEEPTFSTLAEVVEREQPATFSAHLPWQKQERWINCVAVKLGDGLVLTSEDVTKQRIANEKLQESQLLVKKMAEAMPDFLYVEDLQLGRNVYNNRNFLHFLGYTDQDIIGHPRELLDTLYHPEDAHLLLDRRNRFNKVADGQFLEYLVRIKDKQGDWRNIQFRETVFKRGAAGMPVQLVGTAQDLTQKLKADQKLRQMHRTISAILDSLPIIIWRIDAKGRILESMGSGLQSLGYQDHELEGKLITEINPSIVPNIETVLAGNSDIFLGESEMNGKKIYKQNYFVYDPESKDGLGFCLDVTDQKNAEAEAQHRTMVLDQLLHHLPLVLAVLDLKGNYQEIKGAGLRAVGVEDKVLKGKNIFEVFPHLRKNIQEVLSGHVTSFTASFTHQGKEVYFQNFGFLDELHQRGIAFGIDITNLHEAQEKLILEKEFSENLLETHVNGILALDRDFTMTAWNKAMEQLTGIPRTQVLGKSAHAFLLKGKQTTLKRKLEKALQGVQVTMRHLPFLPKGKEFEINLTPLYGPDKEVVGVLGIVWDVTIQKALQKAETQYELSQQKAVMEAVLTTQNEERKRIAEALHNSLAQLLYAARLNLEEVQAELSSGADLTQPVARISGFLEEAIKETRTLAHELIPRVLQDLGLKSALKDLTTRLTSKSLTIQCIVTGFDQPTDYALETHIFRTVQELLNNVMKHAQATETLVQVVDKGTSVRIRVEDNGKGMAEQEPATSATRGMGLKTIKNRLKLLQGEMAVTSSENGGTIITIEIPNT
ncbi:PAS domain S-box protein [Nibribacter ruber]|uniref:Oxygen sensor histidine kinase NreB n=1 Tax=Nibribacter ruber TaxID=2698458 RepID=A0A6P1P450_9BACT|nr:PAS domain S-box protein [Nibribacter ruber]QHL89217.1 PAS domain S-box protein [Nibribacter ruber]